MRLLFAIDSLTGGGAERVMADLANTLDPARYEVRIVLTQASICKQNVASHVRVVPLKNDRGPERVTMPGLRFLSKGFGAFENVRVAAVELAREVRSWKPDCVLSFLNHTNLVCLLSKRWYRLDVPVICNDHVLLSSDFEILPWKPIRRFLTKRCYPRASMHVAVAPMVRRDLIENFGVPPDRAVTIANGIDLHAIRKRAAEPVDGLPGEPGDLRIVSVGRLSRPKAYDVLLAAVSRLEHRRWQLLLIGDGEESSSLQTLAHQLGIADRVHFLGWQANPYRWMARCDLYVSSSRWEAMPLVLLEALALGLPIIATHCSSGTAEILDDGRHGRLVPIESAEALAVAIDETLADDDARRDLAARATERANAFDIATMVEGYENVFRSVTGVC